MKNTNIYRSARDNYNKSSSEQLNREEAAHRLHISLATLGRYENGESEPSPDVVFSMSKVYADPSLRRIYCSSGCPIGIVDHPYSEPRTLFETGYGLINANKVLDIFKNELFETLSDGVIDSEEIIKLRNLLPEIKNIQKLLSDIEIEIEKHSIKHEIK